MSHLSVEETVRKYSDMVYRLAYAKSGNPHDAHDIMQDVFLKLIRSDKVFNDEEHRKAWLIRVTVNTGKNYNRSNQFKLKHFSELEDYANSAAASAQDRNIERLETREAVLPVVMTLPEKYRVVIHLFYYEELSIAEICRVAELSESNVKSRLHRARNMLKEKLKEVGFDDWK